MFPGMPGASHMHTFLGNHSTDANTTTQSLLANAGSSCAPATDLSAYWIPTLFEHGKAVEPSGVTVYYGSRLSDPTQTVPFPQGFRMIAGDARLQAPTPRGSVNQFYCAGPGGEIGRSADGNWPVCAPTADLMFQLVFPDWASKMASSMHGDVFLAWDDTAMGQRVKDCVVQKAKCNTAGQF